MSKKTSRSLAVIAATLALAFTGFVPAAHAVEKPGLTSSPDSTERHDSGYEASMIYELDPATGAIVDVERGGRDTRIGMVGPGCSTASLCLRGSAFHGYSGAGSMNVSHSNKTSWYSGDRAGQLKWIYNNKTVTGPTLSKYSVGSFSGATVKVTWIKRS